MHSSRIFPTMAGVLVLAVSSRSQACATCGCTLDADAVTGYAAAPGTRLNVQYDYIHQDELRSGTRAEHVVAAGDELEHDTLTRYVTMGLAYSPSDRWRMDVKIPYVIRSHATYGNYDPTQPLADLSTSRSSGIGDLKLIGTYQGLLPTRSLGVFFGVKLPTGQSGTAVRFAGGPLAGQPLDASLQPGTGSTDVILGGYYVKAVSQDLDFTANAQFQAAVHSRLDQPGADFRPGNATSVSLGLRYVTDPKWIPQVQLNLFRKSADQGALADVYDTAGTVAEISPGITLRVRHDLHLFGFLQVPVYSNLDGNQLFPRFSATFGASYAF